MNTKFRIASPVPQAEAAPFAARRSARRHQDGAVGIGAAIRTEGLHRHARRGSDRALWAAVRARARSAGEPSGHDAERSGLGRSESHHRTPARADRGRRGRPARVSRDGRDRSAGPACGRADACGRGHPSVRPKLGAARPEVESRGTSKTSKSAVSRRFVARTTAQLAAWQSAPLDALDLVALLIDGVHVGDHCLIVARASPLTARSMRWACGMGRPRTRR